MSSPASAAFVWSIAVDDILGYGDFVHAYAIV